MIFICCIELCAFVDADHCRNDPVLRVGHWNSYFDAMIYLTDRSKFPRS